MKQLHEIQLNILRDLLFTDGSKYSDLKPLDMENSQFVFHLEKLQENGLIKKDEAAYGLTDLGKEYANRIDTDIVQIPVQAKVTTVLCAVNESTKEYLIYKRLKNPFYGCLGFPTEKPKWGEKLSDAAKRGLKEEVNLDGSPILFAIRHYRVFLPDLKLVEDKIMHAYFFKNPNGIISSNLEGDYVWVSEKELEKFVQPSLIEFKEFYDAFINFKGEVTFKELDVTTSKF